MIKPWPLARNPHLGDDQFHRDDFTIDYTARTVTCPNGVTTHITRTGNATFGARCRGCPSDHAAPQQRPARRCYVCDHDQHLAAARARLA